MWKVHATTIVYKYTRDHRVYGATVARLTPDQKVGSSNLSGLILHVGTTTPSTTTTTPRVVSVTGVHGAPTAQASPGLSGLHTRISSC